MALSDYKFCNKDAEIEAVKSGDSWLVLIDKKAAHEMSSGGAHMFRTKLQAEVFGRQLVRGWSGGTFLSSSA